MTDLARNLDSYADGEETPREPDDRDDAFRAIIKAVVDRVTLRVPFEWLVPLDFPAMMEVIDRLIDVADRNIDVTDPAEYIEHAELPEPS